MGPTAHPRNVHLVGFPQTEAPAASAALPVRPPRPRHAAPRTGPAGTRGRRTAARAQEGDLRGGPRFVLMRSTGAGAQHVF